MTVYFGENLKSLRQRGRLTQQELADALGVSFQTISKWENGITYPDIAMLPGIALYFNITVDELLGVNKLENEKKIKKYIDMYDTMHFKNVPKLLAEFKNAYKEFPNDYRILVRYMELLNETNDKAFIPNPDFVKDNTSDEKNTNNPYKLGLMKNPEYEKVSKEIISIYDTIQKHCTDDDIRIWSKRVVIETLVANYYLSFDEKTEKWGCDKEALNKAKEIASTLPTLSDTREMLKMNVSDELSQWYSSRENAIEELLYLLQNTIEGYCYYDDKISVQYKIDIINHLNALFKIIDNDEHISKNRCHLIYNYSHLGKLYYQLSDYENAIKYFWLSAKYAKDFDSHPELSEKLLRFFGRGELYKELDTMSKRIKALMLEHHNLSDEFKATDEFKEIIEYLE